MLGKCWVFMLLSLATSDFSLARARDLLTQNALPQVGTEWSGQGDFPPKALPMQQFSASQIDKMKQLLELVSERAGGGPNSAQFAPPNLSDFAQNLATMKSGQQAMSNPQAQHEFGGALPGTDVIESLEKMVPMLSSIAYPEEMQQMQKIIGGLKQTLLQVHQFEEKRAYGDIGHGTHPDGGIGGMILKIVQTLVKMMISMIQKLIQRIVQRFQQMIKGMRPRGLDMAEIPLKFPMALPAPPPMPDLGPRNKPFPWYFVAPSWYNSVPEWWMDPTGAPEPQRDVVLLQLDESCEVELAQLVEQAERQRKEIQTLEGELKDTLALILSEAEHTNTL